MKNVIVVIIVALMVGVGTGVSVSEGAEMISNPNQLVDISYSQGILMMARGDHLMERDLTVGPPVDSVVDKGDGEYYILFGKNVSGGLVFGGYVETDDYYDDYPDWKGYCNGYIDTDVFLEGSSPEHVLAIYDPDGGQFALKYSNGALVFDDNLTFWTSGDAFSDIFVDSGNIEYDGVVGGIIGGLVFPSRSAGDIVFGHTVLIPGPPMPFWSWDPGDDGLGGVGNWNTTDLNWDYIPPPGSGDNAVWVNGLSATFETGSGVVTINEGGAISVYAITFNSPDGAYTIDAASPDDSLNLIGGAITAETNATINAKVTASDFSKLGSGELTLNNISGLTDTIGVAAGKLILGDSAGLPVGVTGVTFGADSTLVNNSGGLMDWTGGTTTVNGNFRIGAGDAMKFADIDPGADGRVINIDSATEIGRFTGDRSDVAFGGTGTMTLTGTDSDFSGDLYIRDDLTVVLNGTGTNMLDGPVHLNNNAVLRLDADDQLGTDEISLYGSSTLDVNSRTETIGRVSMSSPDARIALTTGSLTMTAFDVLVGGTTIDTGASGILTLTEGNQIFNRSSDSETVTIGGSGTVSHDGDSSWRVNNSSAEIDLQVDAKITGNGATAVGVLSFEGGGTVLLTNPNNHFNMNVPEGRVIIGSVGAVNSDGELRIGSEGEVALDGGQVIAPSVRIDSDGLLSGHGTVAGKVSTSPDSIITADGGELILGDADQFAAFNHRGELHIGSAAVVVKTKGFASLGPLTTLAGGTLSADNGIVIGPGSSVFGSGSVDAKISSGFGSTIEATGSLSLGDANAYDGFFSDGSLLTGAHTVTIHDRNVAVLGSLTKLGDGDNGGVLTAGNAAPGDTRTHFLLEQGKNMVGRGFVNGNYKNHGDVIGDGTSAAERLIFDSPWTVSGKGTFTNTLILGTFAPGESPGITSGANQGFGGTVQVELGGTDPGFGNDNHDQINDTAMILLFGSPTLEILSWNSFVPEIGDEFVVMTWQEGLDGAFGNLVVHSWFTDHGIDFEPHYNNVGGAGNLTIEATPEPATLAILALGGLAIIRRRRH